MITEVILRLVPPQLPPTTLVAVFPTLEGATGAVIEATRSSRPSMLEFMDNPTIRAVEAATRMGLDVDAAAMLVIQSDGHADAAAQEIAVIEEVCLRHGATECFATADPDEGEAFVQARRTAIPAIERTGTILLEDVGVPAPRLGDLVLGIEEISRRRDVTIAALAHAGDGNTHPVLVFDPADDAQQERAHLAYGEVMALAIALGGTITGEHGVGRLKRPWLGDYLGDDVLELNERIKKALDPQAIMNPGAVFAG